MSEPHTIVRNTLWQRLYSWWYWRRRNKMAKAKTAPYRCSHCGSDDVEETCIRKINTGQIVASGFDTGANFYCNGCDSEVKTLHLNPFESMRGWS